MPTPASAIAARCIHHGSFVARPVAASAATPSIAPDSQPAGAPMPPIAAPPAKAATIVSPNARASEPPRVSASPRALNA